MIDSLIQSALKGEKKQRVPFWFMRQAGRYLPEYRELRAKAGSFLKLCYNPDWAAEVTIQPIRRFNMDAAILFSDILVIPHAMGQELTFVEGEGPKLGKLEINSLHTDITKHLSPIAETVKKVRSELAKDKSLIGFCGSPWTVACYMVEGGGSRDYEKVRKFALQEKEKISLLIDKIIESSVTYLSMQIVAGADVIQVFDSWAGIVSEDEYENWIIKPTKKLIEQLKKLHPDISIIGFPRGSGMRLKDYAEKTGAQAVGVDLFTPIAWAKEHIHIPLQGNLDPLLLAYDKNAAIEKTKSILDAMQDRPFIFNLGHGIVPSTPIENVEAVCNILHGNHS
jgi:uroporphyrinogen decarboxylase